MFISYLFFPLQVFAQKPDKSPQTKEAAERQILAGMRIAKKFIENREWEKARLKLKNIIDDFPHNRQSDIAYYWLAYTLFQQKNFSEAEQAIGSLQRTFSESAWIDESKSLLVEINSQNKRRINLTDEEFSRSDDEEKAFAIQNLLETDHAKAIIKIDEILNSIGASAATNNLKESVLILLFDDKSEWATDTFIRVIKTERAENLLKQALIGLKKRDRSKTMPVLGDFLAKNTNENLLDAALYAVSGLSGETAVTTLVELAKNDSRSSEKLRQKSIIWLGNIGSNKAVENLRALYGILSVVKLKQQIQISLAEINKPESINVLIALVEGETDKFLIRHGLEMLKRKVEPSVLKNLMRKLPIEN